MRKIFYLFSIIYLCLLNINTVSAQINSVYISEILYDSPFYEWLYDPIHNNGEYFKLTNPTCCSIDISSWVVTGDKSYEQFAFPAGTIMPAQSVLLVAYKSGTDFDFASYYHLSPSANVIYQSTIILCNIGEKLSLYDAKLNFVDGVTYGDRTPDCYDSPAYISNSDLCTYDKLLSYHRTQVSYANAKVIPSVTSDLTIGEATPLATESALANNTTPEIPLIAPPQIDLSLVANQNYIITSIPTVAKTTSVLGAKDERTTFQYIDGLGRPIQTIQKGLSPTGGDLASYTEYDGIGRLYKQWLQISLSQATGFFVKPTDFVSLAGTQYGTTEKPYSITEFEPTPLNRVIGKMGAGASWQKAADPKKSETSYQTNGTDIANFYVNSIGQLQRGSNYSIATLYKTESKDEDGKTVTEYRNKLEQVILKQNDTNVKTYFVYNDLGQLSYVLPPLAVDNLITTTIGTPIADSNDYLKKYCYLYKYDERGNCKQKRQPGCEFIYMVYDKANRLVLSQDGNQRQKSQWAVTKYDMLGRVVYTGIMNSSTSQISFQETLKDIVVTENFPSATTFNNTGYSCTTISGFTTITPLIVNYYDSYDFLTSTIIPTYAKFVWETPPTGFDPQFSSAKGLLTGKRTYLLDNSNTYLVNVMYYDEKGQVVQSKSSNHLGGITKKYLHYNFDGTVNTSLNKQFNASGNLSLNELYTYEYDAAGRPTFTYYKINSKPQITLSENRYDDLGRLTTKLRHSGADTETYSYNIRSWTKSITSGTTFAENLCYNEDLPAGVTACYNGNIAYSNWRYNIVNKGYAYSYDNLNRLTDANFKQETSTQVDASFDENFTYDKHGNITTLKRRKDNVLIDDLTMVRTNTGNQLSSIGDAKGSQNLYNLKEYQDKNGCIGMYYDDSGLMFYYDANGNMIKDYDRNILLIKYNILNLPEDIWFTDGSRTMNVYDASGRKLWTRDFTLQMALAEPLTDGDPYNDYFFTNYPTGSSSVYEYRTDYVDNVEFKSQAGQTISYSNISRVSNTEGYATNCMTSYDPQYYYYRKDHLGSIREVWRASYVSSSGTTIAAATTQRIQYYPSGLPWYEGTGASTQAYKYNAKEFLEMHGYDTYDYGARGYYPAIGSFTSADPLAEKYYSISPYAYCAGNPVKYIDPDGKKIEPWWLKGNESVTSNYKPYLNTYVNQLNQQSGIFNNVFSRLYNDKKETYRVSQEFDWSTAYTGLYKSNTITLYGNSDKGDVYEEFFHAAQNNYYGSKYIDGDFKNEFEAKLSKIYSGIKEKIPELLQGDPVLDALSKSDKTIIVNYLSGNDYDKITLKTVLDKYTKKINEEYDFDGTTQEGIQNLNYLKSTIKDEQKNK